MGIPEPCGHGMQAKPAVHFGILASVDDVETADPERDGEQKQPSRQVAPGKERSAYRNPSASGRQAVCEAKDVV